MAFKLFKQNGKDVIINIDNIIAIKADEATKKTVIYSNGQINEIDESLDEIKKWFGVGPKKEIKGF